MNDVLLISKISNMVIMVAMSITNDNLNRCKHYLNDDMFNLISNRVIANKNNFLREMFDEPNVATVEIVSREEESSKEIIKCNVLFKAVHYMADYESFEYKTGDNYNKEHFNMILTLEKNVGDENIVYTCPNCGANVNVTYDGVCTYCSIPFDSQGQDYIITNIELKNH